MNSKQIRESFMRQMRRAGFLLALAISLSPLLAIGWAGVANAEDADEKKTPATSGVVNCEGQQAPAADTDTQQGQQQTPVICDEDVKKDIAQANGSCPKGQCIITQYLNPFINALAATVGIAVTIRIIWCAIMYQTSADNPQKVSAAKSGIVNAVLVLLGFFLFYAFLNYVIPGGVTPGGGGN